LGYDTINDITACPGTDTCNLGIASSTGIAEEKSIKIRVPQYKENREITIKISGCMNACGQHNMSAIGFRECQCWKISGTSSTLGWWEFRNGSGRFQIK
jgi:sulfite reductase (ferredoxin)